MQKLSFGKQEKFWSKVFQALRIEVNDELGALIDMLKDLPDVLNPNGRVVIMSYHSLEDRLVKRFFKTGNIEGEVKKDMYGNVETPFKIINRKVIVPDDEEMIENVRSRSAKLRIAEFVS
jgi:16S rRNA (cytosine1402-N4)-methyltransferase